MCKVFLSVSGLRLHFGGLEVLRDVDCTVEEGEIRAIIGPNGAGKTSMLNCINGIYRANAGSIKLVDQELLGLRPYTIAEYGVGRTFQNVGVFPELTVLDNILLGRHLQMTTGFLAGAVWFGRSRRQERSNRSHCMDLLELFGLAPYARTEAGHLPYGKQKQIDVVRSVAMRPRILLMDEPVAGLSHSEKDEMVFQIQTIREQLGVTILLIDHDMRFVMGLSDSVLVLDFGSVLAVGTPEEVQANESVRQAYLGSSRSEEAPPSQESGD